MTAPYATCRCGVVMTPDNTGCQFTDVRKFGSLVTVPRVPHDRQWACGDCNARHGATHHEGCDVEACAVCGGQAFGCPCLADVCRRGTRGRDARTPLPRPRGRSRGARRA